MMFASASELGRTKMPESKRRGQLPGPPSHSHRSRMALAASSHACRRSVTFERDGV